MARDVFAGVDTSWAMATGASFTGVRVMLTAASDVGGYLGGLAVSLWTPAETLTPRTGLALARLRALGVGLLLLALPAGLAWLLASSPTLICSLDRPAAEPREVSCDIRTTAQ
ncbi:hypothetical protein D187_004050 [Cystobacter fuscus DSM 2262]|uniref:Uncharacterized protein n=2 Tax=Cystobacter fuscus TaxID=43 RepID=S9QAD3_CYSF2|nr:hypothetical protein D187_004050 [Cystobacter fuscus DSM 2262]